VVEQQPAAGLSASLAPDAAAIAPALAGVLRAWDRLEVELGEVALVTDDHPLSRLTALVATWYGALPVLLLGRGAAPADLAGVRWIAVDDDPDATLGRVRGELASRPGAVAIELSGRADVVDFLLEALPTYARVLLAGERRELLTIDYYVNLHRKGLVVHSGRLQPVEDGNDPRQRQLLERASRLLSRPERVEACRRALHLDHGDDRRAAARR
jgi:hypothetical protein